MEKEAFFMAIRYKVDVMASLKEKGYSSTKIREEKLIGQSYLQQLRHGELVSWKTLDTICSLLDCQPGDLIEFVREPDWRGRTHFGKKYFQMPHSEKARATLPPNVIFIPEDGFGDYPRYNKKVPSGGT